MVQSGNVSSAIIYIYKGMRVEIGSPDVAVSFSVVYFLLSCSLSFRPS